MLSRRKGRGRPGPAIAVVPAGHESTKARRAFPKIATRPTKRRRGPGRRARRGAGVLGPSRRLDVFKGTRYAPRVAGSELVRQLQKDHGCTKLRPKGSDVRIRYGECFTTVPVHAAESLKPGFVAGIRRDLEPCLGKGWMER